MSKGHRTQFKRERNASQVDRRPSAKLSNARVSSRKAGFVLNAIRGKNVSDALGIVSYSPRYASKLIKKILLSAMANAKNNNNMEVENLYIAECFANNATTYKRMHPRAQGRAYSIMKRNSHITLILDERKNANVVSEVKVDKKEEGQDGAKS